MNDAKAVLPRYYRILEDQEEPFYLKCKRIDVDVDLNTSLEQLWEAHDNALQKLKNQQIEDDIQPLSLLDLKAEIAKRILKNCTLCERQCGVNRIKKEKGYCKVTDSRVASEFTHWGEEPELTPSHTIFFAGCTFSCVFCQNWDISQNPKNGRIISPKRVAEIIERRSESTKNTNWVGGDPTSNLPFILETLRLCNVKQAQVWNSNMYLTKESLKLLDGVIDLYLTDFKYGNDVCAKRLSNAENYWGVITRNHRIARDQCELIIRHLVLPNHFECCTKPVLTWIANNLESVRVNVMNQYHPDYNAHEYEDLKRRLTRREFSQAYELAEKLGLSLTR